MMKRIPSKLILFLSVSMISVLLLTIGCSSEPEITEDIVKEVDVEVEKVVESEILVEEDKHDGHDDHGDEDKHDGHDDHGDEDKHDGHDDHGDEDKHDGHDDHGNEDKHDGHDDHGDEDKIVVIDALGRELTFDSIPSNVATISPTATEMVYAAGGKSILRDRASNHPEEVTSLPDVGSAYNPTIETIIASRPDVVVIEALTQARFVEILSGVGLTVFAVKAENVNDITSGISALGKLFGTETTAQKNVSAMQDRLDKVGNNDGRSVLMLISDADRNLYAALPSSYTGLIAAVMGLVNKAEDLSDSGPFPGFALMTPEAILMANPDIIVTITPAPEPAPRLSDSIVMIPPFGGLKAIQNGSLIEADVELFLQAPGPRIVEAAEFLKSSLNSMK